MTETVAHDPTTEWLADNFSLDTPWPRPREAHQAPDPVEPPARWTKTRTAARVAGRVAGYALPVLLVAELVDSDQPGGGVWG